MKSPFYSWRMCARSMTLWSRFWRWSRGSWGSSLTIRVLFNRDCEGGSDKEQRWHWTQVPATT
jgi:hypothetical protein